MVEIVMVATGIAMVVVAKWHVRVKGEEREARSMLAREIARAKAMHPGYKEDWRDD